MIELPGSSGWPSRPSGTPPATSRSSPSGPGGSTGTGARPPRPAPRGKGPWFRSGGTASKSWPGSVLLDSQEFSLGRPLNSCESSYNNAEDFEEAKGWENLNPSPRGEQGRPSPLLAPRARLGKRPRLTSSAA